MNRFALTYRVAVLLAALGAAAGCQLELDGASCPCTAGWTCCTDGNVCVEAGASCPGPGTPVTISPGPIQVPTGQQQSFSANQPVTWQIREPGGGAIDETGVYEAPAVPGTYTVVATSTEHPDQVEFTRVTVTDWRLDLIAGAVGGFGYRDTRSPNARFGDLLGHLVVARTGIVYVADCANNAIRAIDPSRGVTTTLAGPAIATGLATDAPFGCPIGLALDEAAGILYVAGSSVYRVELSTGAVTLVAAHVTVVTGAAGALALDGNGHLYFTQWVYPELLRRIDLATGAVTTVAGAQDALPPRDGIATEARLDEPRGLAWSPSGALYIADGCCVRRFDPATAQVTTIAGTLGVHAVKDGVGTQAQFYRALDLAFADDHTLLVTDHDVSVRALDLTTGEVTSWFGGNTEGGESVDGPRSAARIHGPSFIATDPQTPGAVYVADDSQAVIRVIHDDDVQTAAGTLRHDGTLLRLGDPSSDYGVPTVDAQDRSFLMQGTQLWFASPIGTEIHWDGVSTMDKLPYRLAITPDGAELYGLIRYGVVVADVTYPAGKAPTLSAFRPVVMDEMTPALNSLQGLALDDHGGLFISTGDKAIVYRVDLATSQMVAVADLRQGTPRQKAFAGALLFVPGDPALLYVADGANGPSFEPDASNHVIWAIDLSSGIATVAFGALGMPGIADGVGADARFDAPWGLAVDGAGTMYASDLRTVRRVNLRSRTVRTLVGSGAQGLELGALPACLNRPTGIAVRGNGELWITDAGEPSVVSAHAP